MKKSSKLKCLYCEFGSGRMKILESHVTEVHGFKSARDSYVSFYHDGIEPKCGCGCGGEVAWSWSKGFAKFKLGHNGNIKACYGAERAEAIREKRAASLRGQVGWARGLTKENSEVIKRRADASAIGIRRSFEEGRHAWNRGLDATSDARVAKAVENMRATFTSGGRIAWHKGQSKNTSDGLRKMSASIVKRFADRALRDRLTALKRLSAEEIVRRLQLQAPTLELLSNIQQYTRDRHNNLVFRCKECGDTRERSLLSALSDRCYICKPHGSRDQLEISKFIRSLGVAHVISNRSEIAPYELDIWSSHEGLAVEYNGLYFHSENFKDKNYHANKSALAFEKNIKLIHVFEDEWRDKREIVESVLSHKFGRIAKRISGRKCEIKKIDPETRRAFFNKTHLDGDAPARIAWGLFYGKELVSCLSLRKPFNHRYEGLIELCRFSSALKTQVIGGLGKLIKVASAWARENKFNGILTYVDTRHGDGKGYSSIGFNTIGKSSNRFWWTDDVYRYDRFVFRANSKLGLTEQQVAKRAGVKKIWGCPNLIMTLPL